MGIRDLALKIIIGAEDRSSGVLGGVRGNLGGVGEAVSRLKNQLFALVGTYAGITGIKNALSAITDTGGRFEKLGVQMAAVMGSIKGGETATQWVKDFAKNTPFEVEGVSQAFVKLKAFGLDPMNGTMQAIADQTSKLGGGQQELEGIVLALGQAWTKQKFQAEEANQLIERGVPVWELLSQATGKTTSEITKMSEAGQLGRKEIQLLIDAMGKSSQGASEAMMKTWTGQISNLKDTWSQFLAKTADSGLLDYAKEKLSQFLAYVDTLSKNGQLNAIADQVSGFFVGIGKAFETAGTFLLDLGPHTQTMTEKVKPLLGDILKAAESLSTPFVDLFKLLIGKGTTDTITFGTVFKGVMLTLIDSVTPIVSSFDTDINLIAAGFYGLSGTISEQIGKLIGDYAEFAQMLGLPFQTAENLSQSFAASASENFAKADQALIATSESAERTKQSLFNFGSGVSDNFNSADAALKSTAGSAQQADGALGQLGKGGEAVKQTVDGVTSSAGAAAKATGDLAAKVDQLPKEPKTIYVTADTHEYTDKISTVKQPTSSTHTIEAANSILQVKNAKGELEAPTHSTHYIHVVEVKDGNPQGDAAPQQATGGLAGQPTGKVWKFAQGGWARMAGLLSGYGGGDRRKALLEDGEYVVRKEAVKKLGVGVLDAVNTGELPLQRSSGGGINLDEEWRNKGIEELKKLLKQASVQPVNRYRGWNIEGDAIPLGDVTKGFGLASKQATVDWAQAEMRKIVEKYGLDSGVIDQANQALNAIPAPENISEKVVKMRGVMDQAATARAERGFSDFSAISNNLGQNLPTMPAMPAVNVPNIMSTAPAGGNSGSAGQTVTVRFLAPGQSVSGQFNSGDVQHLLDTLKAAGARTA